MDGRRALVHGALGLGRSGGAARDLVAVASQSSHAPAYRFSANRLAAASDIATREPGPNSAVAFVSAPGSGDLTHLRHSRALLERVSQNCCPYGNYAISQASVDPEGQSDTLLATQQNGCGNGRLKAFFPFQTAVLSWAQRQAKSLKIAISQSLRGVFWPMVLQHHARLLRGAAAHIQLITGLPLFNQSTIRHVRI